ncbi:MAG: hypothetical protein BWY76_00905 [bacterium ADurb.Bin429]|nr:MAG: hypothetical protein BWY76_00905 [bacterium ADurb.Bin429]
MGLPTEADGHPRVLPLARRRRFIRPRGDEHGSNRRAGHVRFQSHDGRLRVVHGAQRHELARSFFKEVDIDLRARAGEERAAIAEFPRRLVVAIITLQQPCQRLARSLHAVGDDEKVRAQEDYAPSHVFYALIAVGGIRQRGRAVVRMSVLQNAPGHRVGVVAHLSAAVNEHAVMRAGIVKTRVGRWVGIPAVAGIHDEILAIRRQEEAAAVAVLVGAAVRAGFHREEDPVALFRGAPHHLAGMLIQRGRFAGHRLRR